mmetsp:Transcript_142796/g.346946  ORF Transcript_142796/g.346946 Transcript_142796/m.346946 type:complete len:188 (-) Transcript_142796:207-770(-)
MLYCLQRAFSSAIGDFTVLFSLLRRRMGKKPLVPVPALMPLLLLARLLLLLWLARSLSALTPEVLLEKVSVVTEAPSLRGLGLRERLPRHILKQDELRLSLPEVSAAGKTPCSPEGVRTSRSGPAVPPVFPPPIVPVRMPRSSPPVLKPVFASNPAKPSPRPETESEVLLRRMKCQLLTGDFRGEVP